MKLREDEFHREKSDLLDRQQQLSHYIDQLHSEKSEMIRCHTLETGELRKKNAILREHAEKMELSTTTTTNSHSNGNRPSAASAFHNEFADYENITIDPSPWDEDYSMVNEFSLETEPHSIARSPTPTPNHSNANNNTNNTSSMLLIPKKSDKQNEKNNQGDFPFSWNAFYMCLLFGAFVASNSSSSSAGGAGGNGGPVSAPAIPPLSDEYRAESANVLKAVLASASEPSQSLTGVENGGATTATATATAGLPTTISGAEMAQMTSGSTSRLDTLHHDLVAPTKEQEEEEAFALSAEQYRALTTLDDDDGAGADAKPPAPSNLQQAYAAMRNTNLHSRSSSSIFPPGNHNQPADNIYSRSLLWDRVPDKVVRDFRRMVKECGNLNIVKDEDDACGSGNEMVTN